MLEFESILYQEGKTATGIQVPPEIVEALGKGKRPPVTVTFNDFTYRSTVAPMGGAFWIPVSAEIRAGSGATAGDTLKVTVELDEEPRTVEVPDDLTAALDADAAAKDRFAALSYSNQRRIVLSVTGAKTEETRQRRIAKAIEELQGA